MWVRNGLQIRGQAMTYTNSHFCNSLVDLDLYLLQVRCSKTGQFSSCLFSAPPLSTTFICVHTYVHNGLNELFQCLILQDGILVLTTRLDSLLSSTVAAPILKWNIIRRNSHTMIKWLEWLCYIRYCYFINIGMCQPAECWLFSELGAESFPYRTLEHCSRCSNTTRKHRTWSRWCYAGRYVSNYP